MGDMDARQGTRDGQGGAIVEIERAAGGAEAYEWAELLLRMYRRWAERHGLRATLLDREEGEEAGIAYARLEIGGPNAYDRLKAEHGVHRLVRIPPSDPAGRRHVSFAIVLVTPAERASDGGPGDGDLGSQIRT